MPSAVLITDVPDGCGDEPPSWTWPTYQGRPWDGEDVIKLYRRGVQPLMHCFDIRYLVREIEERLNCYVLDVPLVGHDRHFLNFHMTLYGKTAILAQVFRVDVNEPANDSFRAERHTALDDSFELAVYDILARQKLSWIQKPLYFRGPHESVTASTVKAPLSSLEGRRLLVFPKTCGERLTEKQWVRFGEIDKTYLLVRAAQVAASFYLIHIDTHFADSWMLARLFGSGHEALATPVAPTRDFCRTLLAAKVNQLLGYPLSNLDVHHHLPHVRKADFLARGDILRALDYMLPKYEDTASEKEAYRFVLEHDRYSLDSLTIAKDRTGHPAITAVRDWSSAKILPAILTRPQFVCSADLGVDRLARPSVYACRRACGKAKPQRPCMKWSRIYFEVLFDKLPGYQATLRSGKYARELWYALCDWEGEDQCRDDFFDGLGRWAERIITSQAASY